MYALFEEGIFKAFIPEITIWEYQTDTKYMLYKINSNLLKPNTKFGDYTCILDVNNKPVLIPIKWYTQSEITKMQNETIEKTKEQWAMQLNEQKSYIQNMPFAKRLKYLFTKKLEV